MTGEEALTLVDGLLQAECGGQGLNDLQSTVFLKTWAGCSYGQIAEELGYQYDYIKQVGSQLWRGLSRVANEPVCKRNVKAVLRRYQTAVAGGMLGTRKELDRQQDWGEAIEVSRFYDRQSELQVLKRWSVEDRCRCLLIFGLGGVGKTALSVKLAQQVQSEFEWVIWRSLQQAPPLKVLLRDILSLLTGVRTTKDVSLNRFMEQLRSRRCLLVVDNLESVLQGGSQSGQYLPGYEDYRQLIGRLCDETHASCVLFTGREKPRGFALREGEKLPTRSLSLSGLSAVEGKLILLDQGLNVSNAQSKRLVNYLGGNPLALKLAATTIRDIDGGDVRAFLARGKAVFGDLWDLLDGQCERLSPLQQQILYEIAIAHEGITPARLYESLYQKASLREVLEALELLLARSLIRNERSLTGLRHRTLTEQPVIRDYVRERFLASTAAQLI